MWPREWSGRVQVVTFDWSVRLVMSLSLVAKGLFLPPNEAFDNGSVRPSH